MGAVGRYQLEAAAQSAHAVRRLTGATDWAAIPPSLGSLSPNHSPRKVRQSAP